MNNDTKHQSTLPEVQSALNAGTTRRRLLKGVALGAPAILTLRSGAVMAVSSCNTGIKGWVYNGDKPEAGDYCVRSSVTTCDSEGKKVDSSDIGTGDPAIFNEADGTYTCPIPKDDQTLYSIILSSNAYTSLTTPQR
ncbi:hypothetical protein [Chromatium okenii]|uniref:hypothetical protein n=1 Tax=Chromatium okenii TaxID=61644 RepID=UPI0019080C47|nr:hypothetical protein [Chromatium okenii]